MPPEHSFVPDLVKIVWLDAFVTPICAAVRENSLYMLDTFKISQMLQNIVTHSMMAFCKCLKI